MSLPDSPDPALREAVLQRDLGNVLHPIVVPGGAGSTIVDGNEHRRHG